VLALLASQEEEAMRKSKFAKQQIPFALKQADSGHAVQDVFRQIGISEATCQPRESSFMRSL
jgi:hypothetical protein